MQDDPADQLHVEVPHVQHAAAGLADHREGLDQQVVDRGAVRDALAELGGPGAQLLVGERLDLGLAAVDGLDERTDPLQLAFVLRADDFGEDGVDDQGLDGPAVTVSVKGISRF